MHKTRKKPAEKNLGRAERFGFLNFFLGDPKEGMLSVLIVHASFHFLTLLACRWKTKPTCAVLSGEVYACP